MHRACNLDNTTGNATNLSMNNCSNSMFVWQHLFMGVVCSHRIAHGYGHSCAWILDTVIISLMCFPITFTANITVMSHGSQWVSNSRPLQIPIILLLYETSKTYSLLFNILLTLASEKIKAKYHWLFPGGGHQ